MKEATAGAKKTMLEFCGGVDVGGTKISSALFTREGEISAKDKIAIDKSGGDAAADQVRERIGALEAAARAGGGRLAAVGISVPGIAYSASGKVWAPNIPGWDQYPLLERIRGHVPLVRVPDKKEAGHVPKVHVPVVLESDRSAYVAGETWRGAAAGARDAVFLAVGTGIGAGIISGGRILHGHEDIAGAVGWFGLNPAFTPEYASMGCFEAEASGSSVGRIAREKLRRGRASSMPGLAGGRPDAVTAEIVTEAARRNDPLALEIVAEVVTYLAMGIANIVSILNPEVVVVGGGLFQAADVFLDPVRREFKRWAQPLAARNVRIELSGLGEDAGLFGCGKIAWDHREKEK
ncbi:MAG: ROK family protein [Candidatus Aminicenantes bacterium]|nr:ROK family protein [Candidatus Aminicenantes bacterium]